MRASPDSSWTHTFTHSKKQGQCELLRYALLRICSSHLMTEQIHASSALQVQRGPERHRHGPHSRRHHGNVFTRTILAYSRAIWFFCRSIPDCLVCPYKSLYTAELTLKKWSYFAYMPKNGCILESALFFTSAHGRIRIK